MAFVWGIGHPESATIYALSYPGSMTIVDTMGRLDTVSWTKHGKYTTTAPSRRLLGPLVPFEVLPGAWKERIISALGAA